MGDFSGDIAFVSQHFKMILLHRVKTNEVKAKPILLNFFDIAVRLNFSNFR